MKNEASSKVADVSNTLPGEADDFNPFDAFSDDDDDRILAADEEFLAYLHARAENIVQERLSRDSIQADE
jgi:hypothetical protein